MIVGEEESLAEEVGEEKLCEEMEEGFKEEVEEKLCEEALEKLHGEPSGDCVSSAK